MACKRPGAYAQSLSSSSSSAVMFDDLQREVRTIAKGHYHAVAHLLHCSAMPHVACALAVTRGLQECNRRHSVPSLRECISSVMLHSVQSSL